MAGCLLAFSRAAVVGVDDLHYGVADDGVHLQYCTAAEVLQDNVYDTDGLQSNAAADVHQAFVAVDTVAALAADAFADGAGYL